MSRGRDRVLKRRAINGEFLDCVADYRDAVLVLSTRRGYRTRVILIEPETPVMQRLRFFLWAETRR